MAVRTMYDELLVSPFEYERLRRMGGHAASAAADLPGLSLRTPQQVQSLIQARETVFRLSLPAPFVLIVADETGVVRFQMSQPDHAGEGVFPWNEIGSRLGDGPPNAVSVAMLRRKDVFVLGDEPWLAEGRGWSAFVLPLSREGGGIIGYFALFARPEILELKAYPFIRPMAAILENDIRSQVPQWRDFTEYLAAQLACYDLTPRERQLASLWLMDYDYKRISKEMGISENTVRVMTNRMNTKLGVKSKASLILRVLGVI